MVLDRGSINIIEKAIRRVSERVKVVQSRGLDAVLLAETLDEIANEIARIASGKDEPGDTVGSNNG